MILHTYNDARLRWLMDEIQALPPVVQAGLGVTIAELDFITRILGSTDPLTEDEKSGCDRIREKYLPF